MITSKHFFCAALILICSFSPIARTKQHTPPVTFVHPQPQTMIDRNDLEIVVGFDSPIDTLSVDAHSFSVFGRWTGVCAGKVLFEENRHQVRFIPQKTISAGEWVTVTLSKNILSASGQPMSTGYSWNFWTKAEVGRLEFTETQVIPVRRAGESGIRTYGAYAGDLNGDGFHDFTVPNEDASDIRIFLNDGAGHYRDFSIYQLAGNVKPSTNEGADFNGDGLIDFAVGNINGNSVTVFEGSGSGLLVNARTYSAGRGTRGLTVLDLNGDGATDIVTANRASSNISLLLNMGDGTFQRSQYMEAGVGSETSCASADANEDGLLDVYIGGFDSQEIAVLLSDGNGNLAKKSKADAGGAAWMIAVGDVDNDGHVDVVSANGPQNHFSVLRGDGQGNLRPAEIYPTGVFPLAIDLGDLDGDGDLDVVTSNFDSADWTLYENDGSGRFVNPQTLQARRAGSCAVLHDRDQDGDLDITGIDELDDLLFLFTNSHTTAVKNTHPQTLPTKIALLQSYPNPFIKSNQILNTEVTLPFRLETAARVRIELFNLKGQRLDVLINHEMSAGYHAPKWSVHHLPFGMYFYRISTAKTSQIKKLLLLP